jgi:hypothetical protein
MATLAERIKSGIHPVLIDTRNEALERKAQKILKLKQRKSEILDSNENPQEVADRVSRVNIALFHAKEEPASQRRRICMFGFQTPIPAPSILTV